MSKMKNLLFEVSSSLFTASYFESEVCVNHWTLDISSKTDIQKKEVIADFLVREGITLLDYSNALVLWSNQSAVMIPSKLLDYTQSESIMSLAFGDSINKNEFDFNRIPLVNSALIYMIPLWVKSLFVLKFPGSKIIHRMTSCIHYLANKNTSTKLYGILTIEEGLISFVIFHNDQPISCIQNEFQTVEDILYFVTYTIQNLSLAELNGKIEVVNLMSDSIYEKLRDGIASLSIQSKLIWEENPNFKNTIINICV